jgi:hypothetical protein
MIHENKDELPILIFGNSFLSPKPRFGTRPLFTFLPLRFEVNSNIMPFSRGVSVSSTEWLMTTKREMDDLIDSGDKESLREVGRDGRGASKLIRRILARLYSRDPAVKWPAVAAIGVVAAVDVMQEKQTRDLIKRLYWTLNAESGSVPFGAPEALGEIFANRPDLIPANTPLFVSYVVHKEMIQTGPILAGAIWALGRNGIEDPEEQQRALPGLKNALKAPEPELRGTALWTLARLGLGHELRESIEALFEDKDTVTLLIDGAVSDCRLATLARNALS